MGSGGVFFNLAYGGKGKSHIQEESLWDGRYKKNTQGVDHWTALSVSLLWCKKIYTQAKKFKSIFPLGSIFTYIVDFFINLQMTIEWAFAFLNTAVIIFCLRYSLNIPYQTPSFFLCKTLYPSFQNSDFDINRKITLTFFLCAILTLSRQT